MMKFKDAGVDGNVKGVAFLFKKNKIDTFQGTGRLAAPGKIAVNHRRQNRHYRGQGNCHRHRLRLRPPARHRHR